MSANSERDRDQDCFPGNGLDLTAYALNQVDDDERAEVERQLANASDECRQWVEQTRRLAEKVREALAAGNPATSASLRQTVVERLEPPCNDASQPTLAAKPQSFWQRHAMELVAASLVLVLLAALFMPAAPFSPTAGRSQSSNNLKKLAMKLDSSGVDDGDSPSPREGWNFRNPQDPGRPIRLNEGRPSDEGETGAQSLSEVTEVEPQPSASRSYAAADPQSGEREPSRKDASSLGLLAGQDRSSDGKTPPETTPYFDSGEQSKASIAARAKGLSLSMELSRGGGLSDKSGGGQQGGVQDFSLSAADSSRHGQSQGQPGQAGNPRHRWAESGRKVGEAMGGMFGGGMGAGAGQDEQLVELNDGYYRLGRPGGSKPVTQFGVQLGQVADGRAMGGAAMRGREVAGQSTQGMFRGMALAEQYAPIVENGFISVQGIDALSTFSIDVDTAAYANVRRFLTQEQLPPPDAVRLEEMVNYFSYDYPQPKAGEPFSVNMEVAECPWQAKHLLLRVGLKGKEIHRQERPVSNLVFLLDVSGSMADENKLPLLKQVLSMMVRELREDDRVSIVTYAGEAGLRLPPTTGNEQTKILAAIDSLSSGGSTNGSAGIELAYEQAQAYFRKEGTNRVILATDGDLNVGITDDESLVRIIKEKAAGGTFLTVLGFGEGNLKDAKMERLADNGNGLYAYIDSVREGRKVLVEQMSGSLVTIAKDVKIQIEFNPAQVQSYRLLGYENRMLTAPEFADDKRDAGEIGAGHSVTALYELVPAGVPADSPGNAETPMLRYQAVTGSQEPGAGSQEPGALSSARLTEAASTGELLTLKLRYKEPDGMASKLSEHPLKDRGGKFNAASKDFQFAAAVASFGMSLRNSQYRGEGNLAATAEIAAGAIGEDKGGYRAEFVDLVRRAQTLGVK